MAGVANKLVACANPALRIGFIGAGNMAQALARGLVNSGRYAAENIMASCPKADEKLLNECKALGLQTTHENVEVVHHAEVLFVAVKPLHVSKVVSEIAPAFKRNQLLVSIAMGITIRYIEMLLPSKSRVVRVMPNTPAMVGAGCSAYAIGAACQDGDSDIVQDLLSTVGYAAEIPEIHIDVVTGLSASGPSYVFSMMEGLADGGVKMGLSRQQSLEFAAHTFYGAAKMYMETGKHPAVLKEEVQSPGGCTIFGMHELEKCAMRAGLISAVEAATARSRATGAEAHPSRNSDGGGGDDEDCYSSMHDDDSDSDGD